MTVWGADKDGGVQIEVGLDDTDIWFSFNRSITAVQMTHKEGMQFIKEFEAALVEARVEAEIKRQVVELQEIESKPELPFQPVPDDL